MAKIIKALFQDTYTVTTSTPVIFDEKSHFVLQDKSAIRISSDFANVKIETTIDLTWTTWSSYLFGVHINKSFATVVLGKEFEVNRINASPSPVHNHLYDLYVEGGNSNVTNYSSHLTTVEFWNENHNFKNYGSVMDYLGFSGTNTVTNVTASSFIERLYLNDGQGDRGRFTNYGIVGNKADHDGIVYGSGGQTIIKNFGKIYGTVELGNGNDRFENGPGAYAPDTILGGDGNDKFVFIGGAKKINHFQIVEQAGQGIDGVSFDGAALDAYFGNRYILSENIENLLVASSKNTLLSGNTQNNFIVAGSGNDKIFGNGGDDVLVGGKGKDKLYGGDGADTFQFFAGDTFRTLKDADQLVDFTDEDRIDLRSWDANSGKAGLQHWKFASSGSFSGHAGELVYAVTAEYIYLTGDSNGDRRADLVIRFDDFEFPNKDNFLL